MNSVPGPATIYRKADAAIVRDGHAFRQTVAALESWPRCEVPGCSPTAVFSILDAKAHIPSHTGVNNTRLIVHLPLIVRLPGGAEAGRRVAGFTQPGDLASIVGTLAEKKAPPTREFATSALKIDGAISRAIRTPEWALLLPPEGEPLLFQKPDDRWEVNDLSARNAELAEELAAKLRDLHHDLPEV